MGFAPTLRWTQPQEDSKNHPPGNGTALGLISDTGGLNSPKEPLRACVKADGAGKKISSLLKNKGANTRAAPTICCWLFSLGCFFLPIHANYGAERRWGWALPL